MTESGVSRAEPGAARQAGERAVKNTLFRAVGEIGGKLASLVLFAVLARKVSTGSLGTFVFALAWGEVAMTPVGLGIDRYMLRRVAKDRSMVDRMFFNALALKLSRGVPILASSMGLVLLLGYDEERALTVVLITAGMLLETLARTHMSVFNALERGDLVAITIVAQRFVAALLGLAALVAGMGLIAVAAAFAIGGALRLALAALLLHRRIGTPVRAFPPTERRELTSRSLAFTAQDVFGLVIARADVLLLAALASSAVVGIYGSAYRLLDATTFIGVSLAGAFSAMFSYLDHDSEPTVRAVFQRAVKLSLVTLVPVAVSFAILAEPICRLVFGDALAVAAVPLRILAPVVAIWGMVVLAGSLVVSREDPKRMLRVVAVAAVANLGLNLALIPPLDEKGAALAMLLSTVLYVALAMGIAVRSVRGVSVVATVVPPLGAGAAMAIPMAALPGLLPLALLAGAIVYLGVYVLLERAFAPLDLEFALSMVRARLRPKKAAAQ